MKIRLRFRSNPFFVDESGAFTLEAALLLPVAAVLAAGILFSIIVTVQTSLVYIAASESADRLSHSWDNSHKHPATGMFSSFDYDPLYWRWTHDSASVWFGNLVGQRTDTFSYPVSANMASSSLTLQKLSAGADDWPTAYEGTGTFRNFGFSKEVSVAAQVPLFISKIILKKNATTGISTESIAEPAEYIRNIELALAYLPAIQRKLGGKTFGDLLSPWLNKRGEPPGLDRNMTFPHHAEAVKYLRALVHGQERRIPTMETGKWRLIDAMDNYNVAHQAYIGPKTTTKDVTDQLFKDAELIKRGEVSGIVWHFFRRTGEDMSGPSPQLKSLLQKSGIIVVIHS